MTDQRLLAFLTLQDPTGFVMYDDLTFPALAEEGFRVEMVPWRAHADWARFEAVIVRSTWDYQQASDDFLKALERIAQSGTLLGNPLEVIRWNLDKSYLRELEQSGVAIVPTLWGDGLGDEDLSALFNHVGSQIVVKPTVSANADDTFRMHEGGDHAQALAAFEHERSWMAQPFLPAITSEGEHSLFYFADAFSHCVLKTPKPGDFRVQEEHGGQLKAVDPEPSLRAAGDSVLSALPKGLLQARLDFVRHGEKFLLMEAELIEPSLYFPYDQASPARFAKAVRRWVDQHRAS